MNWFKIFAGCIIAIVVFSAYQDQEKKKDIERNCKKINNIFVVDKYKLIPVVQCRMTEGVRDE